MNEHHRIEAILLEIERIMRAKRCAQLDLVEYGLNKFDEHLLERCQYLDIQLTAAISKLAQDESADNANGSN